MYRIIFSKRAERFLDKLDDKDKERIFRALDRIKIRPERFLERIAGIDAYKFRVGDYRLIIDLNKKDLIILVIKVGHRKNVYK